MFGEYAVPVTLNGNSPAGKSFVYVADTVAVAFGARGICLPAADWGGLVPSPVLVPSNTFQTAPGYEVKLASRTEMPALTRNSRVILASTESSAPYIFATAAFESVPKAVVGLGGQGA